MPIKDDMQLGDIGEGKVWEIFSKIGKCEWVDKPNRLYWDMSCCVSFDNTFKIEVKNDNFALKSGNIAIEIWNTRKNMPSGLTSTKSDLWCVVMGDEVWVANTTKLKEFIENTKPKRIIYNGGDDNATLYLYDKDIILPAMFTKINNITANQLQIILIGIL